MSETRSKLLGERTIISTHGTMLAAFKGNDAFQAQMRSTGEKSHIQTKIVTLKAPLALARLIAVDD
jgi:hypothetical protein